MDDEIWPKNRGGEWQVLPRFWLTDSASAAETGGDLLQWHEESTGKRVSAGDHRR